MSYDTRFCDHASEQNEWNPSRGGRVHWWDREKEFKKALAERWIYPQVHTIDPSASEPLEVQFIRLADEWSRDTCHISSVGDLTKDARYQQIIALGWPIVPHILSDLKQNKRFWFPALVAITGLRPFDLKDASNYQRMTDAWLQWGRRKGLI